MSITFLKLRLIIANRIPTMEIHLLLKISKAFKLLKNNECREATAERLGRAFLLFCFNFKFADGNNDRVVITGPAEIFIDSCF